MSAAAAATDLRDDALPGLAPLLGAAVPGDVALLAHRPGRRATLLVRGGPARVVKLFCREEFPAALGAARLVGRHGALAPRLLAVDEGACVLVQEHVDGAGLDRLPPQERAAPLAALGDVLARVHAAPTDGLRPWDRAHTGRKLVRWHDAAAVLAPDVTAPVTPAVTALLPRLLDAGGSVCVHGDLALRNVLVPGDGPARVGGLRLIDWDRTALGPPEADLAPLVGLLGEAAAPAVAAYRAAGGEVDDGVLGDLVLANRLTRLLRRLARGDDPPALASDRLAAVLDGAARRGRVEQPAEADA